ncbi:MAG TPA: SDR family oxidoreductase [Sphingomonadales bacterium]
MTHELKDAIALVTGASGSIGAAICTRLADAGARVIATDLESRIPATSPHDWHPLDVTSERQWTDLIRMIRDRHGRLDILVNNAGIAPVERFEEMSVDAWRRCMAINVEGVFLGMKAATALLAESAPHRPGGAAVINLASGAADRPAPYSVAYCTSKAAVAMMTRATAVEFAARGMKIRVNSVHPGAVRSEMIEGIIARYKELQPEVPWEDLRRATEGVHPMGRFVEADEVADAVLFLASDRASYIHGTAIRVDGGYAAA